MNTMFSLFQKSLQNLILHPLFLPFLLFVLIVYKTFASKPGTGKKLPASPPKLPIIGNLHQLGPSLHRSFSSLSQRYGKLMLLHLGYKPTLVVSCVDAARDIMKTHDMIFSNRPESRIASRIFYDGKDVAFAPYGEQWRLRKSLCTLHLLSNQKVQSFRNIREGETMSIVEKIYKSHSSVVNLSELIMTFTNDVICRAAFGRKYNSRNDGSIIFKELLNEAMELLGVLCFGDFMPCLSWVDRLKGLDGRVDKVAKELDEFLENVVQEHRCRLNTEKNVDAECDDGKHVETLVDNLLEYLRQNKDGLQADNIKPVILNMFTAGTETIYAVVEWTMSELIQHPRIMIELQEQVRKIGGPGRKICEDDLEKLAYLKAVIKEALRLHPPLPLLIYRKPSQDVKVLDFDITAGTQVVINAWAIQRDPTYWLEPDEFRPERFLNNATDIFKGQDNFHYIPFGGGRRICPAISFSIVNAELLVANLINEFDWKVPECEKFDMAESVGITVHKRDPLMLIATPVSSSSE